jgi:integrase/recombinase XerD
VLPNIELILAIQAFVFHSKAGAVYARNTLVAYQADLLRFASCVERATARPASLADFSTSQVQAFLSAESASGLHPHTLARRQASLYAFNHFLKHPITDWESISRAAQASRQKNIAHSQPERLHPLHLRAVWQVMQQATHARARRDQALLALLLDTGLPVHRLLALNLADLSQDCHTLTLVQPSGIRGHLNLDWADQPLWRYLKEGRPELNHQPDEPALWISQAGNRMTRQAVWQVLRGWGRQAGLPFALSPRLISHTAAQRLAATDLPLQQIQLRLGHQSSLSTLARLRRIAAQAG